ncbi:yjeF-related family protein [Mycobacterium kansasii 662]|nr:NAD(P)H-hydrate epimerase [Mycobacterium kansasii ATCC 12478]EUA09138.1 yjeF-related family protein [Mycobacterium kansasii 662]KEP40964.1 NAD(P)H-hydrate epimerase [Mycobacterium kansasii]MXO40100.1 NAD(P)H-hydrate epimerase [Mycobacterium kansasii]POX70177.1 NAD(P)H-hydrate epimerase [Mycobacterium kansasii]
MLRCPNAEPQHDGRNDMISITAAELADLLVETGERHHQAYADTDGADPEWALWYSGYLQARLWDRAGRLPSRSQLVGLLQSAERRYGGAEGWPARYAGHLLAGLDASGPSGEVFPAVVADDIGWLTREQMVEVDRVMMQDLRIDLIQMMENAGHRLARLVLTLAAPGRVAVVAGSGGNGGGGLVAARHLANAGVDVVVTLGGPADQLNPVPAHQFDILRRMKVATSDTIVDADLTVDALIGYSLRGAPRGRAAELIGAMTSASSVVALDTPSGLDVTSGEAPGDVVSADATLTLALPKIGMRNAPQVGSLYLADISVPRSVTAALGPQPPDFSASPILRVV